MLKGVNKQIIEIKCTNNDCFEKILLFVNPANCNHSDENLNLRAKMYAENFLNQQGEFYNAKKKKKFSFRNIRIPRILFVIGGLVTLQSIIVLSAFLLK